MIQRRLAPRPRRGGHFRVPRHPQLAWRDGRIWKYEGCGSDIDFVQIVDNDLALQPFLDSGRRQHGSYPIRR